MIYYEKTVESEYKFEGQVVKLRVDVVEMPNGNTAEREIIEHNGGVCVLPIDEQGNIYFVRQYRHPFEKDLLEIPAGKLNKGEDPLECGIRELKEETGLSADKMTLLSHSIPTPGYTNEIIHIYLAQGLTHGEAQLDEDEFLNVEKYHLSEAIEMARKGDIADGKTLIALFMAKDIISACP